MAVEETVLDDHDLMADRLLRSLHKNADGHLSSHDRKHTQSVLPSHNIAVLYIYIVEGETYSLQERYVYSYEPRSYRQWKEAVLSECRSLSHPNLYGVYGWLTNYLRVTPLRSGDLFIKIDKQGAKGVRLAFDPKETNRQARHEKKPK